MRIIHVTVLLYSILGCFELLPDEILDLVVSYEGLKECLALLQVSLGLYKRYSPIIYERFHQVQGEHVSLSLSKIYRYWKSISSQIELLEAVSVLSRNEHFSLFWGSIMAGDPVNVCLLQAQTSSQSLFSFGHQRDLFNSWLVQNHPSVSIDLLAILFESKCPPEVLPGTILQVIDKNIKESKLLLLVQKLKNYINDPEKVIAIVKQKGYSVEAACRLLRKMRMNEDLVDGLVGTYQGQDLIYLLRNMVRCKSFRPLEKSITKLLCPQNDDTVCRLFISRFPTVQITANNWRRAFLMNYSHELLADFILMLEPKSGSIDRSPFDIFGNALSEDLFMAFMSKSIYPTSVSDMILALEKGFSEAHVMNMLRRGRMSWNDENLLMIKSKALEQGYSEALIKFLDNL